jgi:anti-sigma regulatory factor (Ser/Thr protein kinase)
LRGLASHSSLALGHLYSKLSKADTFEAVDAATYLNELCRDLIASVYKEGDAFIMLKTDIESELLPTERAIPIGLIVNELVTNSVKYGFPGEAQGTVTVTLKRVPGALRLTVADDGQGLDPLRADSGLGGRKRNNPLQFPLHRALKCRARTRSGQPCQAPAMSNGRCRMHGGSSPGAPKGNKNAFKHGRYTADAIARRRKISGLLRAMKALVKASE